MNRPKSSQSRFLLSSSKHASHLQKTSNPNADRAPSFATIHSKFTRRKYKEETALNSYTEAAYNTRSGVLNSSMRKRVAGGNGYCSILRQKLQVADAVANETEVDRRVKAIKRERIDAQNVALCWNDVSMVCEPVFDSRPESFITALRPQRSAETGLSTSFSMRTIRPATAQTTLGHRFVPASFKYAVVKCLCEPQDSCVCGKRVLVSQLETKKSEKLINIDSIMDTCDSVSKEAAAFKIELDKQLGFVKKRLKVFSRHTKSIILGIQRAQYFDLRKKFQAATRVRVIQRHEKNQNSALICVPQDMEDLVESDPSVFS